MPKKFYTEKDIEDLCNSGTKSLRVNDDVALTDLAYEKAKRLGVQLVFDDADVPPLAPMRPYLSSTSPHAKPKVDPVSPFVTQHALTPSLSQREGGSDIAQRIRSAVLARLGNQVDVKLLDTIIQRVLKSTGVK